MANCGVIDPENIDHYIARGGYEGLVKALSMGGEAVIKGLVKAQPDNAAHRSGYAQ